MCSVSGLIAGMSAVSGMMGTLSNVSSRQQAAAEQQKMNNYNIAMANDNARISQEQAADARKQSEKEAKEYRMEQAQKMGRRKTGYAASNVELSGSPSSQLIDDARWTQYGVEGIKEEGERNAWNYNMQANQSLNKANRLSANTYSGGGVGTISSLLSGATSAARSLSGVGSAVQSVFGKM